jgi:hypothetical protein
LGINVSEMVGMEGEVKEMKKKKGINKKSTRGGGEE